MGVGNFVLFCFGACMCVCLRCTGEYLGRCACAPSYRSQSRPWVSLSVAVHLTALRKGSLAWSEVQFGLGWRPASSQLSSACLALAGC